MQKFPLPFVPAGQEIARRGDLCPTGPCFMHQVLANPRTRQEGATKLLPRKQSCISLNCGNTNSSIFPIKETFCLVIKVHALGFRVTCIFVNLGIIAMKLYAQFFDQVLTNAKHLLNTYRSLSEDGVHQKWRAELGTRVHRFHVSNEQITIDPIVERMAPC